MGIQRAYVLGRVQSLDTDIAIRDNRDAEAVAGVADWEGREDV